MSASAFVLDKAKICASDKESISCDAVLHQVK